MHRELNKINFHVLFRLQFQRTNQKHKNATLPIPVSTFSGFDKSEILFSLFKAFGNDCFLPGVPLHTFCFFVISTTGEQ